VPGRLFGVPGRVRLGLGGPPALFTTGLAALATGDAPRTIAG
jgi:hypothetical protein